MLTQSVLELHSYFDQARRGLEALARGDDETAQKMQHGKAALFANRLLRAPATSCDDILLKIEVAAWLGEDPALTLALIRDDHLRLKAMKR